MSKSTSSKRRPLSVWELPTLLQAVHRHRKTLKEPVRERPHFWAILAFVHRNRFVVASQIQRRFRKYIKSDRTARRHLTEMESLGYLDVVDTNNTSPLWPKVYFATRRGLTRLRSKFLEQSQDWSESHQDRQRSDGTSANHVIHELFISEFLLMAWESAQSLGDLKILTMQRRSLARHNAFKLVVAGRHTRLQPDGMFLCRQQDKGMVCSFIEMDLGTMSIKQMEAKFRRYQHWAESSEGTKYLNELYERHGATTPVASFRLLVVVGNRSRQGDDRRFKQLLALASNCKSSIRNRIWLCTTGQINESEGRLLAAPIWLRLKDLSAAVRNSDAGQTLFAVS